MIAQNIIFQKTSQSEQISKHSQVINNVKCSGKNTAKQFCVNQSCQQNRVFTCYTVSCKCQLEHEKCNKCDLSYVVNKIKQKLLYPTAQIKNEISKRFDDIIDKLSQCRNNLLVKISQYEEQINFSNLSNLQCKLLEVVQNQDNQENFTGKQGKFIWDIIGDKQKYSINLFKDIQSQLKKYEKQQLEIIQLHEKRVQQLHEKFQITQKQFLLNRKVHMPKKKTLPSEVLLSNSSIVKNLGQVETLLKFFPKQVKEVRLLYRASQHAFSLQKYFELCGNEVNTFMLCLTSNDKVIGAYSPLQHAYTGKGYEKQEKGEYEYDPSRESFIFSISNKDKFEVKKQHRSIYRPIDNNFICFGANELRICDQSDKRVECCSIINKNYHNSKYRKHDQKSYEMLNGNPNEYFSTKEWEVWQVQVKQ